MSILLLRRARAREAVVAPLVLAAAVLVSAPAMVLLASRDPGWLGSNEVSPQPPSRVAATVDGVAIHVAEVDQRVKRVLGNRTAQDAVLHRLQAEALEHLIQQQSILAALQRRGEACTQQELNLAMARLKDELSRREQTLEEHCRAQGTCVAAIQRAMRWQLSWGRYLEQTVTDESLQRYFADHRAQFDGTRMRVAQILLTWPDDASARAGVEQRARAIRDEIMDGKRSFAAAAEKYSESPSGRDGGALEWISRHAPMPEFFAQAAFQLQAGEISPPVTSPLGVHLIQCVEIEPGTKSWQDVREALTAAVREHLFEWNAAHLGSQPVVEYTGELPHFQPGTRVLVLPAHDDDDATAPTTTTSERAGK